MKIGVRTLSAIDQGYQIMIGGRRGEMISTLEVLSFSVLSAVMFHGKKRVNPGLSQSADEFPINIFKGSLS